jgi:RNA polymerase sigma-70 factor, ECF subfamily
MAGLPDAALRSAYEAHGAELYRFARRALGDRGQAEDAVQETFVRAWRASDRYDPSRASQRTWLFAILRNVVVDLLRARRRRPGLADRDAEGAPSPPEPDAVSELDRVLTSWEVEAALEAVGEDQRRVLVEVHWRGRPYAEVAAELGVPEGTVKSRVYYGLRAMRSALEAGGWRDS